MNSFLTPVHQSWRPLVIQALEQVDRNYLTSLSQTSAWLPGASHLLNAFSVPLDQTHYILFGESPYPRPESANGYAFWDANVGDIWSAKGLSTQVNRATSLRNFMKMLLLARQQLSIDDLSQAAIARIDKQPLIQTGAELFQNLLNEGFLLLNASLVLSDRSVNRDAKYWQPFIESILSQLAERQANTRLILFGKIAERIMPAAGSFPNLVAEHPYNLSFISNASVLEFFRPFDLLSPRSQP